MSLPLFSSLSESILSSVESVTAGIASGVISDIAAIVGIGGTIYYVVMGYMVIGNYIQSPFSHVIKSMLKFGMITGLVFHSGSYANEIVPAMEGLQVGIVGMFTGAGGHLGHGATVFTLLDDGLDKAFTMSLHVLSIDRWFFDALNSGLDLWLAIFITGSALILFGKAASYIIISQAMFLIMLAIGPLFILMLLFGGLTAQWFDRWFGQAFTYMLQMALVSLVASLATIIFGSLLPSDPASINADQYLWVTVKIMAVAMILYVLIDEANSAAGQLAGGISSASAKLIATASASYKSTANTSKSIKSAGGKVTSTAATVGNKVRGAYNATRRNNISRAQ